MRELGGEQESYNQRSDCQCHAAPSRCPGHGAGPDIGGVERAYRRIQRIVRHLAEGIGDDSDRYADLDRNDRCPHDDEAHDGK